MVGRLAAVLVAGVGCSSSTPRTPSESQGSASVIAMAAPSDASMLQDAASTANAAATGDVSIDALESACDGGDAGSCIELGDTYRLGMRVTRDLGKARAMFARACKLPSGPLDGCVSLAEIDCHSDDRKQQRNALDTLDRACSAKSGASCSFAGLLYAEGLCEVPYNGGSWMLGAQYYQKACDLGHLGGCTHLGLLYRAGQGVTKDDKRGKRLLDDACKRGDAAACAYAKEAP